MIMRPSHTSLLRSIASGLGGLLIAASPVFGADDLSDHVSDRSNIEKRLAEVRAELQTLPPVGTAQMRESLMQLEALSQYHLAGLDVLEKTRAARIAAEKEASSWTGFPNPPPYSVLFVDDLRESASVLQASEQAGITQHRIIKSQIESARNKLDASQQEERRLEDDAPAGGKPPDASPLALARVSSRIAAEDISRLTLRLTEQEMETAIATAKLGLVRKQVELARQHEVFTQADIDGIRTRIANERKELVGLLVTASNGSTTPDPMLAWKVEFLDLELRFWESRFQSFRTKNESIRRQALADFGQYATRIKDWTETARLRLETGTTTSAVSIDPEKLRTALQRVMVLGRRVGFATEDLRAGHHGTPVMDQLGNAFHSVWDAELYLAEQTEIVGGNKLTTYRAVTVGKIIWLSVILVAGWILLGWLSRLTGRLVSRKQGIAPGAVDLASRAVFFVGFMLLVIYGLNTVHIPFTALAFLGGALAIGFGFGTQTLLNNFISGIILMFERPFKVGDMVEAGGVKGTIRRIGIRSSFIQHGDGIETLIPNSTLLENQVTNWTLSNSHIQATIQIDVEYGASTREVAKLLLGVADEHGLVLKNPAPEVRLTDLGKQSIEFSLLYWFDLRASPVERLKSDLRFMIEKSLTESGIHLLGMSKSYRLETTEPLKVELTQPADTACRTP